MLTVNLGGTCNNDDWRESLIELLNPNVKYFNPVVKNWKYTELTKKKRKSECNLVIFCYMLLLRSKQDLVL